jgi:ABC-2 type transport system ATP-binding protein
VGLVRGCDLLQHAGAGDLFSLWARGDMSALVLEGLVKIYGAIHALDGLDLTVEKGSVFGFLGPNGAGKTTTLRILAGVAIPTAGKAWVEGVPVGPQSPARGMVGYLPEEPGFYPWMRAREFLVDLIGGLLGMTQREAKRRTEEVLGLVGLEEAAERRVGGFSRGMRQRLGLAQALMNRPQVLLLDEPVSALDPAGRRDILRIIARLGEDATVFMSTHILNDVERICDQIGIIDRGRLIALDRTEDLLRRYALPMIEVVFEAEPGLVAEWANSIRDLNYVRGVEANECEVRITLDGTGSSSLDLQRRVLGTNMTLLNYSQAQPRLEDVFLRLVGDE